MGDIKFGTDGWRAIIAREYTEDNVKRVAEATAIWMNQKGMTHVLIGHDTRFAGKMFAETAAGVFASCNIRVSIAHDFVTTPMISLGVTKLNADMGVVITASHNPPSYNGFKLKSAYGGPTIPKEIAEIEDLIPESAMGPVSNLKDLIADGKATQVDLEQMYIDHVEANFDLALIKSSGIKIAYDAMYGAGQRVLARILPDAALLHCDYNPSFMGQAPEPIHRNLAELSEFLKEHDGYHMGLANDGDADRIGLYDAAGEFVDSHHILLLLLYYLKNEKGMDGKVIITFSVTNKMKDLAAKYGLDIEVTKIGFKYIAEIMMQEDVLVGGEESGGLAIKGHIPERDGVWIGLTILEFMAKTGKSLRELIEEVYAIVGPFSFDRDDLHIAEDKKLAIVKRAAEGKITSIGGKPVIETENIDGYKFHLSDAEWVMVRPSGTEPVLRVYAQAKDKAGVRSLLNEAHISLQEGLS